MIQQNQKMDYILLVGTNLQDDLVSILALELLCALSADIAIMYFQVALSK